ncbi:hypothetical protein DFH11DRAFT_1731072 [Phellopilus nigrolimitatus]|nr:hypothetical protein DFH11DRAFT_1731072 [Phellopilus nigrolimitatus]
MAVTKRGVAVVAAAVGVEGKSVDGSAGFGTGRTGRPTLTLQAQHVHVPSHSPHLPAPPVHRPQTPSAAKSLENAVAGAARPRQTVRGLPSRRPGRLSWGGTRRPARRRRTNDGVAVIRAQQRRIICLTPHCLPLPVVVVDPSAPAR